jgi:hypothetical protein
MPNTDARKKGKSLQKIDWNLALEDAKSELRRTEEHAEKLRNAIPILQQRVQEIQPKA